MKKYLWTLLAFVLFIGLSCQEKTFIEKDSTNDLKMELESLNGSSLKNSKGGKGGKSDKGRPKPQEGTQVGDLHEGGIIFWVDTTDTYGLVCALSNLTIGKGKNRVHSFPWGCTGTLISGAMGEEIGTGWQNTMDIISVCKEPLTAAKLCVAYSVEYDDGSGSVTLDDWFLPSIDELKEMYKIPRFFGYGDFLQSGYWSSTQVNKDLAQGMWFLYTGGYHWNWNDPRPFIDPGVEIGKNKIRTEIVRPVRKFGDWPTQ